MYTIYGAKGNFIVVLVNSLCVRSYEHKFFTGIKSTSAISFAREDIVNVEYIKPKWFKLGKITFIVKGSEAYPVSMPVKYGNRNPIESLYHILKNNL